MHFIVMELIDGVPFDVWKQNQKPDLRRILATIIQIADALATAHQGGIVHRDIKPANLLINRQGYSKVVDFGLAKLIVIEESDETRTMDQPITKRGFVVGTIAYMSPEQATAGPVDARSDIFSLSVVLYEAVAGRRPFGGATDIDRMHALVHDAPAPIPNAPAELQWIIEKALARKVDERYQTMIEFAADLRRLERRIDHPRRLPADVSVIPRSGAWLNRLLGAGFVGVALVALGTIPAVRTRVFPNVSSLPAGAKATQLTRYSGTERSGAISPDGKHFAFVSDKGG